MSENKGHGQSRFILYSCAVAEDSPTHIHGWASTLSAATHFTFTQHNYTSHNSTGSALTTSSGEGYN